MTFRLLLVLSIVSSAIADEWSLKSELKNQTAPYVCPRPVADGEFDLTARLVLQKLDNTAASVRFGKDLNLGFDSRGKTLIVEGAAVGGKTHALGKTAHYISAGKPFDLVAMRDKAGELVVLIDRSEVYRSKVLAGKPLAITFRPHRNTMDILSLKLEGDLQAPPPPFEVRTPKVPILLGSENKLAEIILRLDRARTLSKVSAESDLGELMLVDQKGTRHGLNKPMPMGAGEHRLQMVGTVAANARLAEPVRAIGKNVSVHFSDGATMKAEVAQSAQRLAFPIHRQGEVDCHTTRIPALAKTKKGTLLGVYDLRYNSSRDLQEHIDIGLSRSTDGGQTWESPRAIMDMGEYGSKPQKENGVSDPNILVDPDTGRIFVSAVWTNGKPNTHQWKGDGSEPGFEIGTTAQFMVVTSDDDGVTWSEPQNWTRKLKKEEWYLFAPAPGNGIALDDGTLVMPTQGRDKNGLPFSNLMWSRDHGETWTVGAHARDNTTECAVATLSDGALLLNMRDNRNRKLKGETNGRALGVTRDLGKTWSVHPGDHSALPEPVCMASMISHKLPDGRHMLLFSNPHDKHARRNITIQASFDDGKSWPNRVLLDEGTGRGYSSLVMVDDETVGILYESSRANLVFQKVSLEELL